MTPTPRERTLEALQDERDDLKIRISLGNDKEVPDFARLRILRERLEHIERLISLRGPADD